MYTYILPVGAGVPEGVQLVGHAAQQAQAVEEAASKIKTEKQKNSLTICNQLYSRCNVQKATMDKMADTSCLSM